MDVVLVLIFAVVFLCSFLIISAPKGIPPGPLSIPVVGSYFFNRKLRKKATYSGYLESAKVYGNIFSYKIGSRLIVVLHGYDAIYQALVKQAHEFSDRPTFLPGVQRFITKFDGHGIVFEKYNSTWKMLRRFTIQTLRDFGVGKSSIEEKIMIEVDAATKVIEVEAGRPFEIAPLLAKMAGNVIYGIVFGQRFEYSDSKFEMIHRMSTTALRGQGANSIANFFPLWVTWIFDKQSNKEARMRADNLDTIKEFILERIKEHEDSFDENNIRDFVDLYIQVTRDSKEGSEELFKKGTSLQVILELFIAGTVTTYNTLDWAFLYMAEYPDIQAKCQHEIQDALGDKIIQYADRGNLKYVDATLSEIQRAASILPISVQHCTSEDTKLFGYHIPKDTVISPCLFSANYDPKYWKEPHKFNPNRFIDGKGKLIKNDALIPFSVGPRTCAGEPLARMELFLIFANMLQRFTFEREDVGVKHSMVEKPNQGLRAPYPYKMRIKRRQT